MIKNLTFALVAAAALGMSVSSSAASPVAPDIYLPTYTRCGAIVGLSDNGKYAVSGIEPQEYAGAVFYDLTGPTYKATALPGEVGVSAHDVTNDGLTVVGMYDYRPAVCRYENGAWTWHVLDIKDKTVVAEDLATGKVTEYLVNGGHISAVTPDGRYAVGRRECLIGGNGFGYYEEAFMWDLAEDREITVPTPRTNRFGGNDWQSRYNQISSDGRYILCWNSFSVEGSYIFVYDREQDRVINIDMDDAFAPRVPGYIGYGDTDGITKSLTSDGRYVAGGITRESDGSIVPFLFDVFEEKLHVLDDGINTDVQAWGVSKDGLAFCGGPVASPYADASVFYDGYLFPMESLYRDVYGMNLRQYGLDITGKPTLVSDPDENGNITVSFVIGQNESYIARFKEDVRDGLDRIKFLGSRWAVSPAEGSQITKFSSARFTFTQPIELTDPDLYADVVLLDAAGNVCRTATQNGGLIVEGQNLTVNMRAYTLNPGEKYTLSLPEGLVSVKGRPSDVSGAISVSYVGRADVPVEVKSVSPADGSVVETLSLSDNPISVTFDVPVKISEGADRPVAHLYIKDAEEPLAPLAMDVLQSNGTLVIYPTATLFLYTGTDYVVKVPAGAVTDLSGTGANLPFEFGYKGAYIPQMGDEFYLFKSTCDNYTGFLFYEGDHGTPVAEYQDMNFTRDETPWSVVREDESSTDMAFASHSCYVDGRQSNDWFATTQIIMPDDVPAFLKFQSQSYRKNKQDRLKVYVYENDLFLAQLTSANIENILLKGDLVYDELQSPGATEGGLAGEWTDNVISLEKYMGKKIYICFLNDNQNQSMVIVDNIFVEKEVDAYITITGNTSVVNASEAPVKGIISITNPDAAYESVSLTLLDSEGSAVSEISASGLNLKEGDIFSFEFPKALPVVVGEENPFSISYTLGSKSLLYEGVIRNLAFQPLKGVLVEEFSGRDCVYCPLGLLAMENLISKYGDRIVPVVLCGYNGDPKGSNMTSYMGTVFAGNTAAPIGRINRRTVDGGIELVAPMYQDAAEGRYHFTAADVPGSDPQWLDVVQEELGQPSYLGLEVTPNNIGSDSRLSYTVTVRSALNLDGQNVRVLGILLEDKIQDYQSNALWNETDPNLGEFGKGGIYGSSKPYMYCDHIARGYWGQGVNGTSGLLPEIFTVGEEYTVEIEYAVPSIVKDVANTKMAVVLIDGDTGKVLNAAMKRSANGVGEIADGGALGVNVSRFGDTVTAEAEGDITLTVYSLDGRILKKGTGNGTLTLSLDGYRGLAIVTASTATASHTSKILF